MILIAVKRQLSLFNTWLEKKEGHLDVKLRIRLTVNRDVNSGNNINLKLQSDYRNRFRLFSHLKKALRYNYFHFAVDLREIKMIAASGNRE